MEGNSKIESGQNLEREPSLMTPEELRVTIDDAEKARKAPRWMRETEFKDWWLGKKGAEGGKKLAEYVFDRLFERWSTFFNNKIRGDGETISDVSAAIEPYLKQLIEDVAKHGGQEHVWQYFREEWKPNAAQIVKDKIWQIYERYLGEISGRV